MRKLIPILVLATMLSPFGRTPVEAQRRPNIVILMSDDQRWDVVTRKFMPRVSNNLVNTGRRFPASIGTAFTNAFVPNPICCPSRTSTLTGRYSHTTGIYANGGQYGGFGSFNDKHTIATDLHAAGYRTAMIGKYLNGYSTKNEEYIPPGWDRWFAIKTGAYYNYVAESNGKHIAYGRRARDYSTRVLGDIAIKFVDRSTTLGRPFFLYLAFTAPHQPATPQPRDVGRFASVPVPHPPSFNVSEDPTGAGKPGYIRARREQKVAGLHEKQLESAFGVDRVVGHLLRVLPANTLVVYMSDNGFLWGEHRWVGKGVPYNESLRVPIILRSLDGSYTLPLAWSRSDIVLNVDLRPTLEAAARVPLSTSVDGLDWASDAPRSAFVLEHGGDPVHPTYCGVREASWMYTRYLNGFEELYHESTDPYEMDNLVTDPIDPSDQAAYDRTSQEARALCTPVPPGFSWSGT